MLFVLIGVSFGGQTLNYEPICLIVFVPLHSMHIHNTQNYDELVKQKLSKCVSDKSRRELPSLEVSTRTISITV
jgi:hypothetical protein